MTAGDGERESGAGGLAAAGAPRAVVFGCSGTVLGEAERRFFEESRPLGFILFGRNIASAGQVRTLAADLRRAVSRPDAPILVDQEGGRVQRIGPPRWPRRPAMRVFGKAMALDPEGAVACARLNAELISADLRALGIDVNCAPVLDLDLPGGHDVIGDRAFSGDPEVVAALGRAVSEGLMSGGVVPVVKHLPGHGRAAVDSHVGLPRVRAPLELLSATDFAPFAALADAVAGMTAHVVYEAIDGSGPASASRAVIAQTVRRDIGFNGLLFSDDICMGALSGRPQERVAAVLEAGCDVALHCNGNLADMRLVAEACPAMTADALARLDRARGASRERRGGLDRAEAARQIGDFLAAAGQPANRRPDSSGRRGNPV